MVALAAADPGDRQGRAWLAEALVPEYRASVRFVEARIAHASSLVSRMPRLLDAMRAGLIEYYPASRVLDVTAPLSDEQAREVDTQLAEKLSSAVETAWQPHNLVRIVRRLVEKVDPGGRVERARKAEADRKVVVEHGDHAQSELIVSTRSEVVSACYARVDAMARQLRKKGESRTLEQLRTDIAVDLLLGNDPGAQVPQAATMVYLHMPVDTALSISETGVELDGYGPIPGALGREIMTNPNSVLRKVLCDPGTGDPVDLGRSRYRPTTTLREAIRVRDRECTIPWCRRPARHCDTDHLQEWARDHGPTSLTNLAARCRRHHRMKNTPGWTTRHDPTHGTTTVTTPLGRTHTGERTSILSPKTPKTPARPADPDEPPPF
ncbi:HNH endonuclease signature motif containing protein [Saccharomonospora sp. CUA-673]|uniref:HNH endonuclease signature motif containing protein n=1 Tax=Saccharomonospora sp. CUA-673 TaxID=1904969 RepID=UPI0009FA0FC4|nr:HNH endonuclease signature motif containing protein [Saccharomonospora sp. CUA-673]